MDTQVHVYLPLPDSEDEEREKDAQWMERAAKSFDRSPLAGLAAMHRRAAAALRAARPERVHALEAVADAARKLHHWHDAHDGGMVVSGDVVREVWAATAALDALSPAPAAGEVEARAPLGYTGAAVAELADEIAVLRHRLSAIAGTIDAVQARVGTVSWDMRWHEALEEMSGVEMERIFKLATEDLPARPPHAPGEEVQDGE
jgi:hypothetical protein